MEDAVSMAPQEHTIGDANISGNLEEHVYFHKDNFDDEAALPPPSNTLSLFPTGSVLQTPEHETRKNNHSKTSERECKDDAEENIIGITEDHDVGSVQVGSEATREGICLKGHVIKEQVVNETNELESSISALQPESMLDVSREETQENGGEEVLLEENGAPEPREIIDDTMATTEDFDNTLDAQHDDCCQFEPSSPSPQPTRHWIEQDTESVSPLEPESISTPSETNINTDDETCQTVENMAEKIDVEEALMNTVAANEQSQNETIGNQEHGTMVTNSLSSHLDSDTAILQAFLDRKQANKNTLQTDSIARRTSLQNRRDSDAVRQALASPRVALEDKDINSPSLGKPAIMGADASIPGKPLEKRKAPSEVSNPPSEIEDFTPGRRSTRKRTRIPSAGNPVVPPTNITVKGGADHVVLQRSEVQQLAYQTRANTRKNKFGALEVKGRLVRLAKTPKEEVGNSSPADAKPVESRNIAWSNPLVTGRLSPSRDDDSGGSSSPQQDEPKEASIPQPRRIKRLRNGTPGRGVLSSTSALPSDLEPSSPKVTKTAKPRKLPSPRKLKFKLSAEGLDASPAKKLKLAPTTSESKGTSPKKYHFAPSAAEGMDASPKKMSMVSVNASEAKENSIKPVTPRRKSGIPVGMAAGTRASGRKKTGEQ